MKLNFAIIGVATLALMGCGGGASNSSANSSAATNSAAGAPATSNAPAGAGTPATSETLVGTWGQDNCSNTMTFAADGTATSTGATSQNVRWTLENGTIVLAAAGQPETRMPATISGDSLQLGSAGGQSTVLTRCAAATGAATAQPAPAEGEAPEAPE